MTSWEYKLVDSTHVNAIVPATPKRTFRLAMPASTSRETVEALLNQLGAEGWEVVSANWAETTDEFFALLKRPRR